jgi:hypothetical protein
VFAAGCERRRWRRRFVGLAVMTGITKPDLGGGVSHPALFLDKGRPSIETERAPDSLNCQRSLSFTARCTYSPGSSSLVGWLSAPPMR